MCVSFSIVFYVFFISVYVFVCAALVAYSINNNNISVLQNNRNVRTGLFDPITATRSDKEGKYLIEIQRLSRDNCSASMTTGNELATSDLNPIILQLRYERKVRLQFTVQR